MNALLLNPDGDLDGAFFEVDARIDSFEAPGIRHPDGGTKYPRLWRLPLTSRMRCYFVKSTRLGNAREAAKHLFDLPHTNRSLPECEKTAMLYGGCGHRKLVDFTYRHQVVHYKDAGRIHPKFDAAGFPDLRDMEWPVSTYNLHAFGWENLDPSVSAEEWLPFYLCRELPIDAVLERVFLDYSEFHRRNRDQSFVRLEMIRKLIY